MMSVGLLLAVLSFVGFFFFECIMRRLLCANLFCVSLVIAVIELCENTEIFLLSLMLLFAHMFASVAFYVVSCKRK